jgi:hypothetical protein
MAAELIKIPQQLATKYEQLEIKQKDEFQELLRNYNNQSDRYFVPLVQTNKRVSNQSNGSFQL